MYLVVVLAPGFCKEDLGIQQAAKSDILQLQMQKERSSLPSWAPGLHPSSLISAHLSANFLSRKAPAPTPRYLLQSHGSRTHIRNIRGW